MTNLFLLKGPKEGVKGSQVWGKDQGVDFKQMTDKGIVVEVSDTNRVEELKTMFGDVTPTNQS